jgi:hypothetical protein
MKYNYSFDIILINADGTYHLSSDGFYKSKKELIETNKSTYAKNWNARKVEIVNINRWLSEKK